MTYVVKRQAAVQHVDMFEGIRIRSMRYIYYASMYAVFILVFSYELIGFSNHLFMTLSSCFMVMFLISSLYMTRGFQLYVSVISLLIGHLIVLYYNPGMAVWQESMTKGIGMPLLFVVIPMISFPIRYGPYLKAIEQYAASGSQKPGLLFLLLAMMHLAMSIVLSIGSVSTLQKLIGSIRLPGYFLSLLYTAGYASYMVFSPFDAILNMVLILSSVTYMHYFTGSVLMVITIISVVFLLICFDKKLIHEMTERLSHVEESKGGSRHILGLFGHIAAMIFLTFISELYLPFSSPLYGISLVIFTYSLFWSVKIGIFRELKEDLQVYSRNFLAFKGFLPFLISASFLGSLISVTPLKQSLSGLFLNLNLLPPYVMIFLLILITMIMAVCGIHMLITITVLAATISPVSSGLSPPAFALLLLSCWFIAMSMTPFSPFVVVVADVLNEKPHVVAFRYNLRFSLVMLVIAPLIICGFNYVC